MGRFFQFARLVVLTGVLSCSTTSYTLDDIEPFSPPAKLDYMKVVDVLTFEDIRNAIAQVGSHGLNPNNYWDGDWEEDMSQIGEARKLKLKRRANQNFLRLLSDISIGAIDPESLTPDIKMKRKKFLTPAQLQTLIISTGQNATLLVDTIAPQNPPYKALKTSLQKVSSACQSGEWVKLTPVRKVLRLGVKNPAVVQLKKHFAFLGYPITNPDEVVDAETVNAINDIEWNIGLKPDGAIHPTGRVWKFLRIPCMTRVRQIQADMEKLRWFPNQFEDRYVFINLAMAYFVLVDTTQSPPFLMSFRTINGRAERKSPTMRDRIVRVILNPYWVVPPTIFIEDKVKEIRTLPRSKISHYFNSHFYEVWNKAFTRRLKPESIDWWAFDDTLDSSLYIRQRPNYMNALGVIKFELTNSFSVYLHDTNQRELFLEPQRLLSSGCIRLEKPFDLAEYVLKGSEWDRAKIENATAKPGQVMPRDTPIQVANPLPVYTVFLTSFLSSDGIIRFAYDTYQQNDGILEGLDPL